MKLITYLKKTKKYIQSLGLKDGLGFAYKVFSNNTQNVKTQKHTKRIQLRPNSTDLKIYEQIFFDKNYEINWEAYVTAPKVIIDGGANIGLFSILMSDKFPNAKILALEPDHDNFNILQQNTKEYSNIICINKGIWSVDTNLKIFDKYNMGNWGYVLEESDEIENTTPAINILSLMNKYKLSTIDILKLDIETSEKYVFSKNYQEWLPKVKVLVVEIHDWIESGCGQAVFGAINECMNDYSYLICGENTIIINNDI